MGAQGAGGRPAPGPIRLIIIPFLQGTIKKVPGSPPGTRAPEAPAPRGARLLRGALLSDPPPRHPLGAADFQLPAAASAAPRRELVKQTPCFFFHTILKLGYQHPLLMEFYKFRKVETFENTR